jgi:hypothetical protein
MEDRIVAQLLGEFLEIQTERAKEYARLDAGACGP